MRYHNITKDDMLNGSGLRTVLWLSGCEHLCKGCHNPITWDVESGLPFDAGAQEELFQYASKDYISGLTLSGGDPLHMKNRDEVGQLAMEFKKRFPEKNIWLYTGYLWNEIRQLDFIPYIDVIVDGKYDENLKDEATKWCGSANQRVIDVKESLRIKKVVLLD